MSQYSSNSGSYPVFFDATSSADSSGFAESTAPCDNLASLQRNWILVSPQQMNLENSPSEVQEAPQDLSQTTFRSIPR